MQLAGIPYNCVKREWRLAENAESSNSDEGSFVGSEEGQVEG
jgi:hypothetical protein